jgi:molybdenum cofactor cytidylyltransferase
MPPAARAHPVLVRSPRLAGRRITELHLGAAPLTADVQVDFAHELRFYYDGRVIPVIVLAAGMSSRMGRPKATLPLDGGDTFLTRIIKTFLAAGVSDIIVVVGHDAETVISAVAQHDVSVTFVENPDYEQGQLTSLLAGLRVVDRPGVGATLITLVDVPLIRVSTVRAVVDRYLETHAPVVRPVRVGAHGHPVLIDRSLFGALRHADPRLGAKPVVRAHASAAGDVATDDEGAFADADTPEDYERLRLIE